MVHGHEDFVEGEDQEGEVLVDVYLEEEDALTSRTTPRPSLYSDNHYIMRTG